MTKRWPEGQIDHRNNNRSDDRWANLRLADSQQNAANKRLNRNNKTGFKGVHFLFTRKSPKKYRAQIFVNQKLILLGYYENLIDAALAYQQAAKTHFGEFARF